MSFFDPNQPDELRPVPPVPKPQAPVPAVTAKPSNICERCNLPADETHQVTSADGVVGPRLCKTCVERAAREARQNAPEEIARQAQIDRELAEFRERQRIKGLRPPRPEHLCAVRSDHGAATVLRGGLLLCRSCAEKTGHAPGESFEPVWPEAPIVALERRVAALEAALAQQPAKASKKAAQS